MAVYKLDVVSFDSVSLQTSDLEAWFERGDGILDTFPAQNVDVEVPGNWPQRVDVQYAGKAFPVHIRLKDTTSTKLLALQKLFAAGQGVKLLRATDGAGTTLRLSCESLGLLSTDNPVEFIARLWATKPLWENDTATTSAHLHCAGDSHVIPLVNNGSAPAKPVITVKFNAAKTPAGGPAYFRHRCFPNSCANALKDPDGEGYPTLVKSGLDTATLVTAGKMLANGNDLLVWVDGVKVDRWLYGMNTANTSIWANIPWVARRMGTLVADMTASVPADGGSIEFAGDISTWPAAGYFYTIAPYEFIYYTYRIGKTVYGIKRAQKGTAATTHTVGDIVYVVEHDIRYTYGDAGAGTPPASTDLQPMIDLGVSTWAKWAWPTAYRADATLRSAQWQQGYENKNALCVKLRGYEAASKMQVEDALPEAGKPNRNTWQIALPAGCTFIHHDVSVPANMLLQVWGDDGMAWQLLKEYTSANDGDGEEITPAATIYALQYRALVRTVTGSQGMGSGNQLGPADNDGLGQGFVLDQTTVIYGFVVRLKKVAGVTGTLGFEIRNLESSLPADNLSAYVNIDVSTLTTSFADYLLSLASPVTLPAGSYVLTTDDGDGLSGEVDWDGTSHRSYAPASSYEKASTTWTALPEVSLYFLLFGDGSVCQPEAPSGSGEECTIDDIELTLATPFPAVTALSEKSCYLWEALLTLTHADATVQTLSLLVPAEVLDEMEIDCEAQTVINKTTGESVACGITASDKGWLTVTSPTDSLTYAEAGMTDTDVTVVLRDTYAA